MVEGEYKAGTLNRGKVGISDMSIRTNTLGRMDYAVGKCLDKYHALSQMSAGIWLKLQTQSQAQKCPRRSLGFAALGSEIPITLLHGSGARFTVS